MQNTHRQADVLQMPRTPSREEILRLAHTNYLSRKPAMNERYWYLANDTLARGFYLVFGTKPPEDLTRMLAAEFAASEALRQAFARSDWLRAETSLRSPVL